MSEMRNNLILYFTLGYPDQETVEDFIELISPDMVDYVEFGFPSRSPVYDGPRIRATHKLAKENYDAERSNIMFQRLRDRNIPLYSLTYFRDIVDGPNDFFAHLSRHGFSGMIIPDLLVDYSEEAMEIISAMMEHNLHYIPFFNPSTPDRVIRNISSATSSWVYYGMQPSTGIAVPFDVQEVAERARDLLPGREINFGFGIRDRSQVEELVRYGANGVAIGTAIVDFLSRGDKEGFSEFIRNMRGVLDGAI